MRGSSCVLFLRFRYSKLPDMIFGEGGLTGELTGELRNVKAFQTHEKRDILMAPVESPTKNGGTGTILHRPPSSDWLRKLVAWSIAGSALLLLGGFALVGTFLTLIFVVPLLIFFSPVLIPLGILLFLGTAGTIAALGSFVAGVSVISWTYNYYAGRDPPGSDRVDAARERIVGTARELKDWASNYSSQMRAAPSA
ncbi:hypothetical protein R1sor_012472 [Riccia sorocarpa]|uniref:Oleosin n=1 Tax=Riccia sorocarpa TaxID=122646 RepID=A0ABD3I7Z4_9MARC